MEKTLFWISIIAIAYTYLGYPLMVWGIGRLRNGQARKSDLTPTVSVIVACHNQADEITARIQNLLACDYPADRLEILIVSDGSTDATASVACRFASRRVRVFGYPERRGKAHALNVGMRHAKGEIVVFTDARQWFDPSAIRHLTANFADDTVGAVSGELLLTNESGSHTAASVGLYWKYEKWIRKSESRAGSMIGATGAIYAIRRRLWEPLPPTTLLDDVYTPMRIALGGWRVVFDEQARAYDVASVAAGREFVRKARTLTGNYQLLDLLPQTLLPTSLLAFQFYSHKLMRLVAPLFFLLLFFTNLLIVADAMRFVEAAFYGVVLLGQIAFYASVALAAYLTKLNRSIQVLNLAYLFSVMNVAAVVGLFYFLTGKRDVWVSGK